MMLSCRVSFMTKQHVSCLRLFVKSCGLYLQSLQTEGELAAVGPPQGRPLSVPFYMARDCLEL